MRRFMVVDKNGHTAENKRVNFLHVSNIHHLQKISRISKINISLIYIGFYDTFHHISRAADWFL